MITLTQAIISRIKNKTKSILVSDIFVKIGQDGNTALLEAKVGESQTKISQTLVIKGNNLSEGVDNFISDIIKKYFLSIKKNAHNFK